MLNEGLTGVELDEVGDLAGVQVDADGVVDLDQGVGVADGAGVVGHQVGDALGADDDLLHLTQLVLHEEEEGGQLEKVRTLYGCFCDFFTPLSPWPPRR